MFIVSKQAVPASFRPVSRWIQEVVFVTG